jgi:hypothetical protein
MPIGWALLPVNDVAKMLGKDAELFKTIGEDRDHFVTGIDVSAYTAKDETIIGIRAQPPRLPFWQATVLSCCAHRWSAETTSRPPDAPQANIVAR